jgi:Tol biopolymer transport system component/DNA-binding winged helix-turn-helix (wHTH) protein
MMASKSCVFRFGDVEVREREFTLVKAGEILPVEPKAFRVLLILLRNPQKLIQKEELLNAVWGDAAVTENSLTRSIALLRRLLGDETRSPRYIETVATVGYRFVCKVEVVEDASGILEPAGQPPVNGKEAEAGANESAQVNEVAVGETNSEWLNGGGRRRLRKWLVLCAGSLVLLLASVFWYLHRPLPPPRISGYTQITRDGHDKYLAGTDGSRLYFTQGSPQSVTQVSIAGGEIVPVQVAVPGLFPILTDVSPDGSSLLVMSLEKGDPVHTIWNVRILGGSVRLLGKGEEAVFSPDGNSVAYSSPEGDIWLMRSDGTGAHKLASTGGPAGWLAWSPDGATIRFSSSSRIWEMSSKGSNLHQLLPGWHSEGWNFRGRWTTDGKFYVFQYAATPSETAQLWALDERRGMFRHLPAQPVRLTTGPIWWDLPLPGKDGKKIFAEGVTPRGELVRFDPQTKQFQSFLGGISAEYVSFSKDGQFVAYVSFPDGILWRANRDGSNPVQLTDPPIYAFLPRWSPDSTRIVFADANSRPYVIYEVSSQGGSPRKLLLGESRSDSDPNWSSDGKKIVFGSGQPDYPDPKGDIRILDLDSHQVTTIPGSVGLFSPRWSPDGRFIAALPFDFRGMKIFDVATQRWLGLPDKGGIGYPAWSRDSKMIYYLRSGGDEGLFRIRVMGGERERIYDMKDWHSTGSVGSWMGLDPTDAPLLLRDIGSSDIYALTLEEK